MSAVCNGVLLSGPRRGEPCQQDAPYSVRGKPVCRVHFVVAAKESPRFSEARQTYARRLLRLETKRLQTLNQIDLFPAGTTTDE